MPESSRNVILTGLARSGTSLLGSLVDGLPDAVALNEPRWHSDWMFRNQNTSTGKDFAKWIAGDFIEIRHKIRNQIAIPERRSADGTPITNHFRFDPLSPKVEVEDDIVKTLPFVRPGLSDDFILAMKHTSPYLSVLEHLCDLGFFRIIAILRHPVGVICSWRNIAALPLHQARIPGAMAYWEGMKAIANSSAHKSVLEKQIFIYEEACKKIYSQKERIEMVKYETLVENPDAFCASFTQARPVQETPITKRKLDFYGEDESHVAHAIQALMAENQLPYTRLFYPEI